MEAGGCYKVIVPTFPRLRRPRSDGGSAQMSKRNGIKAFAAAIVTAAAMISTVALAAPAGASGGPTVTAVSPNSGQANGGIVVTITGTNFTGATAVKFGSTAAASYTVTSSTSITATTPAEPVGTVHTTVTTSSGTSPTSSADDFSFVMIGPADGSQVSGTDAAQTPFTANTPFWSGQFIDVVIPANSDLILHQNLDIVECSAPGGVLPTDPSQCDGESIQGASFPPRSNGSVDLHAQTHSLYQVFALPDLATLGESSGPATCDLNDACVLYVGDNNNDFTLPHFFSPVFYVNPNGGVDETVPGGPAGDGSPLSSGLTLTKATTSTGFSAAGQTIPYTYLVTNTGNNAVTGVSVTDNMNTVSCPSSSLAPGANETCTGSYTTTAADVTAGSVTNTAIANALDSGSNPVSSAPS